MSIAVAGVELVVPLFSYSLTCGDETKATELRKSSPQGWLLEAVRAIFPDIATKRGDEVMRLRLEAVQGGKQTWSATLPDAPADLMIRATQTRA